MVRNRSTSHIPPLYRRLALATAGALCAVAVALSPATGRTQSGQSVVAVVNDNPITNYDIDQRLRLNEILGFPMRGGRQEQRKETLQELIDDTLKRQEATRLKVGIPETEVNETLAGMASRAGMTVESLTGRLKKSGIEISTLKRRVQANLAWNRIIATRYNINTNIEEAMVERRLKAIKEDPSRQPRTIYILQEIRLPVDSQGSSEADQQLLYARFVEAQRIVERFKGCESARQATSGIFNVQVNDPVPVEPASLPGQLKQALDQIGPGKLLGPNRAQEGIQLIGFCGRQSISPPEITREQIENMLVNERVGLYTDRYLRDLRRAAFIDYKDPAYSN